MDIDSYESPDAELLLRSGQERHGARRQARRVLRTEAIGAGLFLAGAGGLALLSTPARGLAPATLAITVVAYLVALRVKFPVGSAWTTPTQLVFVPMLFMLPMPIVPLIVAGCSVIDLWPQLLRRRLSATRLLARVGDSYYSLAPAVVLVAAGQQTLVWRHWPVLLLAFAAQLVCDCVAGLARTWFAERVGPAQQLQMVWLYLTDACLSCAGLLVAASTVRRPGLILLALPLMGLLSMFATERQQRLDQTLTLSSAYRGTAMLLGDVVEAADHYTGIHSREVVDLSLAVATRLGLDASARRNVEFAALLHDVGKIRVPTEIINKPGKLDEAEWQIMRRHTIDGEAMLRQVGGTLSSVGRFVRASHERYDGGGYPDGLVGEEIPIESRIVAACDAYNAMTTNRAYRPGRSAGEALAELRRCAGSHFDPVVVTAIEELMVDQLPVREEVTSVARLKTVPPVAAASDSLVAERIGMSLDSPLGIEPAIAAAKPI